MSANDAGHMKPLIENFGCRLNAFEAEAMGKLAQDAGIDRLNQEIIIVNSCAVTGEAIRQTRQRIRKLRAGHEDAKIIVTGCAAQINPEEFANMQEVDHVLGNREKLDPGMWKHLRESNLPPIAVSDIMAREEAQPGLPGTAPNPPLQHPALTPPKIDNLATRARAHVQIQTGCDHRCTFCIIPYGRGPSRSLEPHAIIASIRHLLDQGFNEVVLTGVDIASWGQDLANRPKLGELVAAILHELPDLPRLRLSSLDPAVIDPVLKNLFAREPRLMPHCHLSLQSGDNLILKRMKRRHSREEAIALCRELRALRPDIVFGADLIAGFPTESEEMFARTLAIIEECGLTWLHVFPYSPRQGTPAARMPQIDKELIKTRAARLREAGLQSERAHHRALSGREISVLIEGKGKARSPCFSQIALKHSYPRGSITRLLVTLDNQSHLTEA